MGQLLGGELDTRLANSPLVGQIQFKSNSFTAVTTTKNYDALNRLTGIVSLPGASGSGHPAYQYQYNAANQRTQCTLHDNSYWLYGYDALGQVISGVKYWPNGTPVPGEQFGNVFDDIGNRKTTTQGGDYRGGSLRSATYYVNDLNQYTSRTVPNGFDILGQANIASSVLVNGSPVTYRNGEFYQDLFNATNSSAPVWVAITNTATNSSGYSNVVGSYFVPQTPESYAYDYDGNLTGDGRFNYLWDAENQLIRVVSATAVGPQQTVWFDYDYQGRRIRKRVWSSTTVTNSTTLTLENHFVYDGWNLVAILDAGNNLLQSFAWGTDLSGSMQGAGGVGGLISTTIYSGTSATTYFYCYDGNGNVVALVNAATGAIAELYEHGPFGELLRATGPVAFANPFRFSTKYQDDEAGLLYYGYRYYNPCTGRWPSRDPVDDYPFNTMTHLLESEEPKSLKDLMQTLCNTYGFLNNSPIGSVDARGLGEWHVDIKDNNTADPGIDVYYAFDSHEKVCCRKGTIHRDVLAQPNGIGIWSPDEDQLGFWDPSDYTAHADFDGPQGSGFGLPWWHFAYRFPMTMQFRWRVYCSGGSCNGKLLSTLKKKVHITGHRVGNSFSYTISDSNVTTTSD